MTTRRKIPTSLRKRVAVFADYRCSYCRSPEVGGVPMVVDHIIPLAAGGSSDVDNLCLACYRCNEFEGAQYESLDPLTETRVALFNPRLQVWTEHFAWSADGLQMVGLTACGRATVRTLRSNDLRLIQARRIWRIVGLHPPLEK